MIATALWSLIFTDIDINKEAVESFLDSFDCLTQSKETNYNFNSMIIS